MLKSTVSYKTLLNTLLEKEQVFPVRYKFSIPPSSWYHEAIGILKDLISKIKKGDKLQPGINEKNYWDKIFTSLGLLKELDGILDVDLTGRENKKIFVSKLKLIFKGPLLMIDENKSNNLGKNTFFELKLFSRLIRKGYNAQLHYDNPDISFRVDEREYAIECKRINKPGTLLKNTLAALKQLREHSLNKPKAQGVYARYGIVAISLARYIHVGDKLFNPVSEKNAEERIYSEMKKIFDANKEALLRPFQANVPALIFDYSDRGSIDIPYTYDFIAVHETANGRYSNYKHVLKDLKKLDESVSDT